MRMLDKEAQIPEFPEQFACTDHIGFGQHPRRGGDHPLDCERGAPDGDTPKEQIQADGN